MNTVGIIFCILLTGVLLVLLVLSSAVKKMRQEMKDLDIKLDIDLPMPTGAATPMPERQKNHPSPEFLRSDLFEQMVAWQNLEDVSPADAYQVLKEIEDLIRREAPSYLDKFRE